MPMLFGKDGGDGGADTAVVAREQRAKQFHQIEAMEVAAESAIDGRQAVELHGCF